MGQTRRRPRVGRATRGAPPPPNGVCVFYICFTTTLQGLSCMCVPSDIVPGTDNCGSGCVEKGCNAVMGGRAYTCAVRFLVGGGGWRLVASTSTRPPRTRAPTNRALSVAPSPGLVPPRVPQRHPRPWCRQLRACARVGWSTPVFILVDYEHHLHNSCPACEPDHALKRCRILGVKAHKPRHRTCTAGRAGPNPNPKDT